MQTSEPYLPFSNNLLYKRIRFDDKLDVIRKVIPIDEKACLLIDANNNFHLKTYLKEDEKSSSLQFPLPPYAHKSNPRVLYSVDYFDLYRYLYKKKPSAKREGTYIQFLYLGDYQLAVQLDKGNPVMILDLHRPQNSPVVLEDVFGVENLISVGNSCLAWYESNTSSVILYHYISRKRKILNFAKLEIEELHSLKDHVIVAIAEGSLEVLDFAKNKIIKSVCFMNGCYDDTPRFAIHSEGNVVSYVDDGYIYVFQTEEGKVKWENHYEFKDYCEENSYMFITNNLIAVDDCYEVHILLLDSQTFSLHTKIGYPQLGFPDALRLGARCCDRTNEKSYVESIFSLGANSFGILEFLCRSNNERHGHQRLTRFILEDLKVEDALNQHPGVDSIKFRLRKSILFEEYRDPVRAMDVFDETLGVFITERGRIFQVNLKNYSVEYITELSGLIKQKKPDEMRQIDKFFALAENKVAVSTKVKSSRSARIAVISLKTRKTEWNSVNLRDGEDSDEEEDEFSFYDIVKPSLNEIFVSYKKIDDDDRTLYKIGKLHQSTDEEDFGKLSLYEMSDIQQRNEILFDRLWNLEGGLIAMRHGEQVSHLSFLNSTTKRIEEEFDAGKCFSATNPNYYQEGICDVKLIEKTVACISLTTTELFSCIIFLYNLRTKELLNTIKTFEQIIIGTIRQCFREHDIMQTMSKMIIFGSFQPYRSGFNSRSLHDVMTKKTDKIPPKYSDSSLCVNTRNWKPLPTRDQALICETHHQRNFVGILKSPNFKLECLRILQKEVGNTYHEYIYRDIVNMIFGVVKE